MHTYQDMQDSGVAWLGKIPSDWGLIRSKYIFYKAQDKPLPEDEVVTAFRDGEVVLRRLRREDGFTFADKEIGYQHVSRGDLVVHAMDAFAGAIGVSKSNGKMSPVCSICRPVNSGVDTKYFAYLLRSMTKTDYLVAIAKGIRERSTDFRYNDLGNMHLPVPPYSVQQRIVEFIDEETAKIDDLISKQKRMLELLEEKRRGAIGDVVTLGLDQSNGYKETNIPWLPNINSSWKMAPLKGLLIKSKNAIKTGPFGSDIKSTDYVSVDKGYARVYTQANIIKNNLDLNPVYISKEKYESLSSCTIMPGDIVMTTRGTLGRSFIFTENNELGILHPCLLRVQLNSKLILPNFFQLLANDSGYFIEQLKYISNSTTIEVLYGNTLRDMKIALPTLAEQQDIVLQVEKINKQYQAAIKTINKQLRLLAERRSSLIAHAVSGKIKV